MLSVRVVKSRMGWPFQAAEYTTVLPSGAKRAAQTVPWLNVSRANDGSPAVLTATPACRPSHTPRPRAVPSAATAMARRAPFDRGPRSRVAPPGDAPLRSLGVMIVSRSKATSLAD